MGAASLVHLVRRYFGSLSPVGPAPADEAWAESQLVPGEVELWRAMPGFDRRHAVGVARRVAESLPGAPRSVMAAALLHDVGKIRSGLGVHGRVAATAVRAALGAQRVASGDGRFARYVAHPSIGADLLRDAGADPLTAAWAAEHHLPEAHWTVPIEIGRALKNADDD